jgi:hypothetical protein
MSEEWKSKEEMPDSEAARGSSASVASRPVKAIYVI